MRKGALAGLLLVVCGAALGATVLHEPLATAASPFTNVVVGNTSTNPVPVTEQNVDGGNIRVHEEGTANVAVTNAVTQKATTVLLVSDLLDHTQPSITVNATDYAAIRVSTRVPNSCPNPTTVAVRAIGYDIATWSMDSAVNSPNNVVSRLIEMPGQLINIVWTNAAGAADNCAISLSVYGRAN